MAPGVAFGAISTLCRYLCLRILPVPLIDDSVFILLITVARLPVKRVCTAQIVRFREKLPQLS